MRRTFIGITACMLGLILGGCSATPNQTGSAVSPAQEQSAQKQANSSVGKKDTIKVKDIDWNVGNSLVDGERVLAFSYTNNSDFDIVSLQIDFQQKNDTTDEQRKDLFPNQLENEFMQDNEPSEYHTQALCERIVKAGESSPELRCTISPGSYYANSKQQEIMEPSVMSIAYLGGDGKLYLEYYDFLNEKYSLPTESSHDAVNQPEHKIGKKIPKIEAPVVLVTSDYDDLVSITAVGLTREDYDTYVDSCKKVGFSTVVNSFDDQIELTDKDGYSIKVSFSDESQAVGVRIDNYDVKKSED